jgi:flagellar biosynthetic protein FliQ
MDAQGAVDLGREALSTAMIVGAPVLLVGVLIGLVIGLLQALTQIQDQTVSFVPKLIMMGLVLVLCLPWIIERMVVYSAELFTNIPQTLVGG